MKKQLISLIVCWLFIVTIIPFSIEAADRYDPLEGGWVEVQDGVTILHLSGDYYEMGYQHGLLVNEKIKVSMRAHLAAFEMVGYTYESLLDLWDVMDEYLPACYKQEMQGMADGSGLSFDDIAVMCMCPAVFNYVFDDACTEISVWGEATDDGNLYHVRSLDWSIYIRDPLTEIPLYNTTILIIREPDDGYWSFIPEFAGSIGCWHGINAQGLAIGENSCITTDATYEGICPWFRMRMVMDTAANAEEAIDILTENITCGTNFILSDATIPTGYALDQTASISYVGSWNDPVEATSPFWQIQDVVRRVPQYVHPDCAAVERNRLRYDPGGLFGIFCIATRLSYMHVGWTHYKALSNEIDRLHGSLDATGLMSLLRNEYAGDTDIFMKIYRNSGYYLHCLYQWVCCPETGEFLISFAENDTLACYNDVHHFNIHDLRD